MAASVALLPIVLMFGVLALGLVLGVVVTCVRMLLRRQGQVQLTRTEAEQLAHLERGLERMEERIGNMETILLDKNKADQFEVHR